MDYDALSTVLNFDACETRSCVNVTILDDLVDEQTEVFAVTLRRSVVWTAGSDSTQWTE